MHAKRHPSRPSRRSAVALLLALAAALPLTGCAPGGQDAGGAGEADSYDARMAREHAGDRPVPADAAAHPPVAALEEREVAYGTVGDRELRGFFARPAATGAGEALPGLIVIHEWWGLNDNIREMTRQLAAEGYAALAVDLYDGQVAETPAGARERMQAAMADPAAARANLVAAAAWLAAAPRSAPRLGSIGWCFGGGWSLEAALTLGDRLDAAVIYYGRLETDPAALQPLQAPILGFFGAEDGGIPVETVHAFEQALQEAGKTATIHVYPGAGHAFANPSGTRYQPDAAQDAWEKTVAFLSRQLRP